MATALSACRSSGRLHDAALGALGARRTLPLLRWLLVAAALAVAGCGGGGGGGSSPDPAEPPVITRAAGGTVTSDDGKVTLTVSAGSASADARGRLERVEPPPEMAADPQYVPGSAYRWTGPALDFEPEALWEVNTGATAVASASAGASGLTGGRKRALGAGDGAINPANHCNANFLSLYNIEPQAFSLIGSSCPAGCAKVAQGQVTGSFGPQPLSVCVPVLDAKLVEVPATCPPMTAPADNEEPYSTIVAEAEAASGKNYTICKPQPISASPWLSSGNVTGSPALYCLAAPNSLACAIRSIGAASAVYGTFKDTTPPTSATLLVDNMPEQPHLEFVNADSSWNVFAAAGATSADVPLTVNVNALQEPGGLRQIELREIVVSPGTPTSGASITQVVRWSVVPSGGSLPPGVKSYSSATSGDTVSFSYAPAQFATRRFFVRAYDLAGNARDSSIVTFRRKLPPAPVINSFVATPSVLQPPGGSATLSWNITGAASAAIDQGIGSIAPASGSTTVTVGATTQYTLSATSALGVTTTLPLAVVVAGDTTGPTVSLAASTTAVTAPGSATLTATAADAVGVSKVEFYRGATLLATDNTAADGYTLLVNFINADAGANSFTARAYDAAGNSTTSAAVVINVGTDTQPPTASLAASASTVLAPGAATLTATAGDNIGVTQVEFRRGSTLIGTDTTPGDGWTQAVNFTAADAGVQTFTARAYDAMNNQTTSNTVAITVTLPSTSDRYASPSGSDASTSCSLAAPCLTIAKAATLAGASGTTWLLDGTYTSATRGTAGVALPAGATLRAANAGVPVLKVPLLPAGSATLSGMRLGSGGGVQAAAGNITLEGAAFIETLNSPLQLSGSASLTMTPAGVVNYLAAATPGTPGNGLGPLALVSGNATLTINGGSFGGTEGLGLKGSLAPAVLVAGNAQFNLVGVSPFRAQGTVFELRDTAKLTIDGSLVQRSGVPTVGMRGVRVTATGAGGAQITLNGSTLSGWNFAGNSSAIAVLDGASASIQATNSTLAAASFGVVVDAASSASMVFSGVTVENHLFGGVNCEGACALTMSDGHVRGNANFASPGWAMYGGLHFAAGKVHTVNLRNVGVTDNRSTLVDGSTNLARNSGLTAAGAAGSVFDLGTAASPGGNTFTGNTTGNLTAGINVAAAAGVTVDAVGNTFIANTQGANSAGAFVLGTAPCGPTSCVVTSGGGANYRVSSGALRLAQ
jgi:hypothetical protein